MPSTSPASRPLDAPARSQLGVTVLVVGLALTVVALLVVDRGTRRASARAGAVRRTLATGIALPAATIATAAAFGVLAEWVAPDWQALVAAAGIVFTIVLWLAVLRALLVPDSPTRTRVDPAAGFAAVVLIAAAVFAAATAAEQWRRHEAVAALCAEAEAAPSTVVYRMTTDRWAPCLGEPPSDDVAVLPAPSYAPLGWAAGLGVGVVALVAGGVRLSRRSRVG